MEYYYHEKTPLMMDDRVEGVVVLSFFLVAKMEFANLHQKFK